MAAFDSKSKKIKNALKAMLASIQYGDNQAFASVIGSTSDDFEGYPVMRVLPNMADPAKVAQRTDNRQLQFTLIGHIPLEGTNTSMETAFDRMLDLTELVLNEIQSRDQTANGLNDIDATIGTYEMYAQVGEWDINSIKGGAALTWNIQVIVEYLNIL